MDRGKFTVTILGPDGEVKDHDDSYNLGCLGTAAYYFYISFILGSVVAEILFFGYLIYKVLSL